MWTLQTSWGELASEGHSGFWLWTKCIFALRWVLISLSRFSVFCVSISHVSVGFLSWYLRFGCYDAWQCSECANATCSSQPRASPVGSCSGLAFCWLPYPLCGSRSFLCVDSTGLSGLQIQVELRLFQSGCFYSIPIRQLQDGESAACLFLPSGASLSCPHGLGQRVQLSPRRRACVLRSLRSEYVGVGPSQWFCAFTQCFCTFTQCFCSFT